MQDRAAYRLHRVLPPLFGDAHEGSFRESGSARSNEFDRHSKRRLRQRGVPDRFETGRRIAGEDPARPSIRSCPARTWRIADRSRNSRRGELHCRCHRLSRLPAPSARSRRHPIPRARASGTVTAPRGRRSMLDQAPGHLPDSRSDCSGEGAGRAGRAASSSCGWHPHCTQWPHRSCPR